MKTFLLFVKKNDLAHWIPTVFLLFLNFVLSATFPNTLWGDICFMLVLIITFHSAQRRNNPPGPRP